MKILVIGLTIVTVLVIGGVILVAVLWAICGAGSSIDRLRGE